MFWAERGKLRNRRNNRRTNRFQYLYTISVFMGVLLGSWMMMEKQDISRVPLRVQVPQLTTGASYGNPGINSLFEMERAITDLRQAQSPAESERVPTNKEEK